MCTIQDDFIIGLTSEGLIERNVVILVSFVLYILLIPMLMITIINTIIKRTLYDFMVLSCYILLYPILFSLYIQYI